MANIAIFRINYKSDFILTLDSDAGWMTPFCIKFWTGAPSQAYFVGFDGETYTHCAPVEDEPTKLVVQFDDHHLPVGELKFQIGYHFTVADFPTSVEDEVLNQAAVIIDNEGTPEQVMLDFTGETAPEIEFSLPAYANEAQRIANEEQRIENEQERIAAEQQRIAQETARVNEFATLKSQSQAATSAANTAASLANEKAQLAADKAALADAAANLATQKAQLAADKAALAQQKAEYAQAQGDYAKAQGDTALADHERAVEDHTQAAQDHTTAANDHITAGNDHTRAEADHTRAESDHAAVEVYVDSLGAFDISAYHATGGVLAKYAGLTAALGTNGANIPEALRKGGMSVKFVQGTAQSSDNKYIRYNLLADSFTTDVTKWAVGDGGVSVKNPEFVYVQADAEDKILWAIRIDGSIYYGAGVPPQIIDYINKKITELSLDEYEDIVAFLGDLINGKTLESIIEDINHALSEKQTKLVTDDNLEISTEVPEGYVEVENITGNAGTCRIDTGIVCDDELEIECIFKDSGWASYGSFFGRYSEETSDAIRLIYADSNNNSGLVNFNTKASSASSIFGLVPNAKHHVIFSNNKFVLDNNTTGLSITTKGTTQEGTVIINGVNLTAGTATRTITWWKFVIRDANGDAVFDGIPCKRMSDGAVGFYDKVTNNFFGNAIDNGVMFTAGTETQHIKVANPTPLETTNAIQDNEDRTELTLDSEGKIVSYRDKRGLLHENAGIVTTTINTSAIEGLSEQGLTELGNALKRAGFKGGQGDWTDYLSNDGESPLCIPEPRCAVLNIISDFNLNNLNKKGYNASSQEGVNYDIPTQIEFWDMQGNYFKKWTLMSGQGSSSMGYTKKNIAFDFFDSEAGGDAFAIKFGDWVPQDSFHLKAYMVDFFKGLSVVSYKLAEQVAKTRPYLEDTVWKRGLYKDMDFTPSIFTSEQIDDMNLRLDSGAKCQPAGFPVIVYQNGVFHGVFAWMIKKHRDNYLMNKSNPNHIHLDGQYYTHKLFNGDLDWSTFEVRNPKNLVYAVIQTFAETGEQTYKYDADIIQAEIAGNSDGSTSYDTWAVGTYAIGKIVVHNGHLFMNTVADNSAEPVYHSKNNADDAPDFKNKTGCGWLNVTNTVSVKEKIIALSGRLAEIHGAGTTESKKALAETYFDVPSLIDYELVQCAVADTDAIYNNCQWVTYDGIQWAACEYDKDDTFGNHTWLCDVRSTGGWCQSALGSNGIATDNPVGLIRSYYQTEAKARWQELVNAGVFTAKNVLNLTDEWIKRIGVVNYIKEYNKWDSRANKPTNINTEYWEYYGEVYNSDAPTYNAETQYEIGDKVKLSAGYGLYFVFNCVKSCTGEAPCLDANTNNMGWKGNIGQLCKFTEENFRLENEFFNSL